MEGVRKMSETSFTTAMTLSVKGDKSIPQRYVLPLLERSSANVADSSSLALPIVDISLIDNPLSRPKVVKQIHAACNTLGLFQVINHGIPISVMEDALDTAKEFFHLPNSEKMQFASSNVRDPVRYGTSLSNVKDKVFCWRDFIKHYANPISEWIHLWPSNPPNYREKMGSYAKAVHVLHKQLMGAVMESLGLNVDYLQDGIEQGFQVMVLNCYPSCPKPDLALGMTAHTDHGTLTILNQNQQGLEIMGHDTKWHRVPLIHGALIVQLGDQIEILSNGRYKSPVHRATVDMEVERLSIASVHSLPIETRVGPIPELVDDQHPVAYKEGSFSEFLDHISSGSLSEIKFIDMLRII